MEFFPDITDTFTKLSIHNVPVFPVTIEDIDIQTLARFVIVLYDRSSSCSDVDATRKDLFMLKTGLKIYPYRSSPCTSYQGGIVWGKLFKVNKQLPSPNQWGWIMGSDNSLSIEQT